MPRSIVSVSHHAKQRLKTSDFFIGGTNMRKIVLYLEEIDLDLENLDDEAVEWVDEESEISLVASHFVDKVTEEYPSTGRMYVRMNDGNYTVRRIREEP